MILMSKKMWAISFLKIELNIESGDFKSITNANNNIIIQITSEIWLTMWILVRSQKYYSVLTKAIESWKQVIGTAESILTNIYNTNQFLSYIRWLTSPPNGWFFRLKKHPKAHSNWNSGVINCFFILRQWYHKLRWTCSAGEQS